MSGLISVSNALITAILDGLELDEAAQQRLLLEAALAPEQVQDVNARTSILAFSRFWARVLEVTGDPFIGLRIGAAIPGDRFGLAAHVAQNSADFREVLDRFSKYASLINDVIRCAVEQRSGRASFTMSFFLDVLDLERHAVDITFTGIVAWARRHLGVRFVLREVRLKHALTGGAAVYQATFGAPIVFGCPTNSLVFDADVLREVIASANPQLGSILDRFASAELSKVPVLADLPARVSQLVTVALKEGRPVTLQSVCAELGLPARHLQRRLKEASTTFSGLLDDVRKALAPTLLIDPKANVEQVGFRLGYSQPTAFIRAFRKWYGLTPGDYRRAHRPN